MAMAEDLADSQVFLADDRTCRKTATYTDITLNSFLFILETLETLNDNYSKNPILTLDS